MRTKKAFYNIVSQSVLEIVTMICSLILPRFILSAFGSDYNGVVASITNFLDYISFLTLGVSGATRVAIYKANAQNDMRKVSAILKATEFYMRKVAYAFIAYMVILAFVFSRYYKGIDTSFNIFILVIIIGFGVFAEYFFAITYRTYLMANQCMYINNIVQIILKLLNTVVCISLISLNQSIQIVKLGSAICYVLCPILLNIIVIKKFKIIKNIQPDNTALKQRKEVLAHSIANCIHQYTDIFLLTMLSTPKIVSVYSVYNLVFAMLKKIQTVFTTGLEAAFGEIWAKGEKSHFLSCLNTLEYLLFSFVIVVFSCAGMLILPFIALYTRGITDTQYILPTFAYLSVITYGAFSLRMPYQIAVQAAGQYKETRNGAFVEAGLNFIISLIGIHYLGLIGVVLGTLAANVFRTAQYALYISRKMLDRSIFIVIKKCIWLVLTVSIILVIYNLIPQFDTSSWINWIIAGAFWFFVSCIVTVLSSLVFYRREFVRSANICLRIVKRRK